MGWSWTMFTRHAGLLVATTVILGILGVAIATLLGSLLNTVSPESFSAIQDGQDVVATATRSIEGAGVAVLGLAWLAVLVVSGAIAAAWYGGLLSIADGKPVFFGSFFRPRNVASVVLASLLIGVLSTVALIALTVPYVGGVLTAATAALVALVNFFTVVSIVDHNLSAVKGIRASVCAATRHPGPVALAWIITTAVLAAGGLLCGGLLVAVPIAYLFKVFTWRRLTGGTVVQGPEALG
jgi:uncharacterized membrane protein